MIIPGFDVKTLSDDDLMKKMLDVSRKLSFADNFSGHSEIAMQLSMMYDVLYNEQTERSMKSYYDGMLNSNSPVVIDTDAPSSTDEANKKNKPILVKKEGKKEYMKPVVTYKPTFDDEEKKDKPKKVWVNPKN